MAEHCAIRILFRATLGLPYRQASDQQKKEFGRLWEATATKWKSSGIKLVGYFGAHGEALDGFSHNYIFEVDDACQVQDMDADIFQTQIGRYIERYSFHIGSSPGIEAWWEAL